MKDRPFPPDPDAGYVRPHAEIHADLLKVNLENSELRRLLSEKPMRDMTPEEKAEFDRMSRADAQPLAANPGEPGIEKLLDAWEELIMSPRFEDADAARAALVSYVEELRKEVAVLSAKLRLISGAKP